MQLALASRIPATFALGVLALAQPAHGEVLIVSNIFGQPSDYDDLYEAVQAAQDGDTLLVLSGGHYGPDVSVTIDGKSLNLLAVGPVGISFGGLFVGFTKPPIVVKNLAADQEVVVRGFSTNVGVAVEDCEGSVWFDDIEVIGESVCTNGGTSGARVVNSHRVTFSRSILRGEDVNEFSSHSASNGLHAENSTVQLIDCTVRGGPNIEGVFGQSGPGSPGIFVNSSVVTLSGCEVRGGDGSLFGYGSCPMSASSGGPGVQFVGVSAINELRQTASTVVGGFTEFEPLCPGTGPQGPHIAGTGAVVDLLGVERDLEAEGLVNQGGLIDLHLRGVEGEAAAVLVSLDHDPVPFPAAFGTLLGDVASMQVLNAGVLPPSGETTLSMTAPSLAPGDAGLTLYAQAAFVDPSPATWLGGGAPLVVTQNHDPVVLRTLAVPSWDAESFTVRGAYLHSVLSAELAGQTLAIQEQSFDELELGLPDLSAPGLLDLTLETASGTLVKPESVEMLPTLRAWKLFNGNLRVTMRVSNTEESEYVLVYGLGVHPAPLVQPNVHYGLLPDLSVGGIFDQGTLPAGEEGFEFSIPPDPALMGHTLHVQAWTRQPWQSSHVESFTNAVPVQL